MDAATSQHPYITHRYQYTTDHPSWSWSHQLPHLRSSLQSWCCKLVASFASPHGNTSYRMASLLSWDLRGLSGSSLDSYTNITTSFTELWRQSMTLRRKLLKVHRLSLSRQKCYSQASYWVSRLLSPSTFCPWRSLRYGLWWVDNLGLTLAQTSLWTMELERGRSKCGAKLACKWAVWRLQLVRIQNWLKHISRLARIRSFDLQCQPPTHTQASF